MIRTYDSWTGDQKDSYYVQNLRGQFDYGEDHRVDVLIPLGYLTVTTHYTQEEYNGIIRSVGVKEITAEIEILKTGDGTLFEVLVPKRNGLKLRKRASRSK